jgi:hypothetical protein
MQNAVLAAHDSIIEARAKQMRSANRHRRPAPFEEGDLVYISTKNMSVPKGRARKLVPKYIGPYRILKSFGNSSFRIALPANLKSRGLHDVFHASLLRIHAPNDDRLFPGRLDSQIEYLGGTEGEWMIERVRTHAGQGSGALFEVLWKSGDVTWLPYEQISKSTALEDYLESQGAQSIRSLRQGSGKPPKDPELIISVIGWELEKMLAGYKAEEDQKTHRTRPRPMPGTNNRNLRRVGQRFLLRDPRDGKETMLSASHVQDVLSFDRRLRDHKHDTSREPTSYNQIARAFNDDQLCAQKLARLTGTNAHNIAVMVRGPPPDIDTRDIAAPPHSPTLPRAGSRTPRDDPTLIQAAKAILRANEKTLKRRASQTHRDKRRQSLHRPPDLDTYAVAGPSSSPRHTSRRDFPLEHVPSHTFESEDAVMHSEVEVAGEEVFDFDADAPVDDAAAEEPAEYE